MVTIILFMVFGLIFSFYTLWKDNYFGFNFVDVVLNSLESILCVIVAGLVGIGVAFTLPMKTTPKMDTYKIVCLQDNNSTTGRFFLGTGQIEGKMKYVFYYEENGGFKMKQTGYENTTVKYSDVTKVERYREEPVESFINYFAIDDCYSESNMNFIIYVPQGTIKNNYSLDAQ
jgi:hypothetical protein